MLTDKNLKIYLREWKFTRKAYVNWVSSSKLKLFFSKSFIYKNFSIWWATSIVSKDNVIDKAWYKNLNKKLNSKNPNINFKNNFFYFFLIFILKFIKNLGFALFWCFIIKSISFSRFRLIKKRNCYHGYNVNFSHDFKNDLLVDRCYRFAFSSKNRNNFFLINIIDKKKYFKNFLKFKIKEIDYIIADEYLKFYQIILIYFQTLLIFFKLIFFLKKEKKIFFIKGKDCRDVLELKLLDSFCGEIQTYTLMGISNGNFVKKNKIKNFINYGEFTPGFRPIYYYVKQADMNCKIVTIQHGNNVLYNYNKKLEFSNKIEKQGGFFSPAPDIYLTHGQQSNSQIRKFFSKPKIIGPLKYDFHIFNKLKKKVSSKKQKKRKKNILICPSIGDHEIVLRMIKKSINKKHNFILSPHPVFRKKTLKYIKNLKEFTNLKYYENKFTFELMQNADFVICGFSSSAHEAAFLNKPCIRLIDLKEPYYHDTQDKIKIIHNSELLKKILLKDSFNEYKIQKKKIIKNFYYKLDNKAYKRFLRVIGN